MSCILYGSLTSGNIDQISAVLTGKPATHRCILSGNRREENKKLARPVSRSLGEGWLRLKPDLTKQGKLLIEVRSSIELSNTAGGLAWRSFSEAWAVVWTGCRGDPVSLQSWRAGLPAENKHFLFHQANKCHPARAGDSEG
jgi:hypothetical protein